MPEPLRPLCLLALAACTVAATPIRAGSPLGNLFSRSGHASDDLETYRLTEEQGPWMILAASFAGPGAERDALQLARELRQRYKLPAYLHSQRYSFSGTLPGIGFDPDRTPKRMRYLREGEFEEYAVLVGDFASVEDPALAKVLKKIKYARPQCLTGDAIKPTLRFAGLRYIQRRLNGDIEKKQKGPLGNAFATRNPLLPSDSATHPPLDPVVLEMNEPLEHSLLDCPGKYSVRVATFHGTVVLDQEKIEEIENGGRMSSRLERAAMRAHRLAQALRQRGIEAYEFHDRHESCVTVGSFDWITRQRVDGTYETNPAVLRVARQFAPEPATQAGNSTPAQPRPKHLDGIPFDLAPWPVEVPKRPLAHTLAGPRWRGH